VHPVGGFGAQLFRFADEFQRDRVKALFSTLRDNFCSHPAEEFVWSFVRKAVNCLRAASNKNGFFK